MQIIRKDEVFHGLLYKYKLNLFVNHLFQVACGAHFEDVAAAADLYGVFDDLYGPDLMFRPCVDLKVAYEMPDDEECVLPVHRGNVLKPSDAVKQPEVEFR